MKSDRLLLLLSVLGVIFVSAYVVSVVSMSDEYGEGIKPIYPYDQWPAWSPDGKQLVFSSNRNPFGDKNAPPTLWIVDLTNLTLTQPILRYWLEYPTWSPDGKLLAFNCGYKIFVFDLVTGKAYPLFTGSEHGFYPSWGPDSRTLAFSAQMRDDSDIWVAELDLNTPQKILKRIRLVAGLRGADTKPVWSPDGRWIAFVHTWEVGTEDIADEVFIIRPDGSGLKKVCRLAPRRDVERLHWLADSRHLLICQIGGGPLVHVDLIDEKPKGLPSDDEFIKEQEKLDSQYEGNIPYEVATKVVRKYGGYYKEVEGKYLVFRYKFDERGNFVYDPPNKIVDISTGEVRGFTLPYEHQGSPHHPVGAGQIAVSPDGKRIAFMSNSSDYPNIFGTSIWVANLDGSDPKEVTKPPQPPDPEIPIISRLDPNFPIPMFQKVGSPIELELAIFNPSGWEATKDIQFRFMRAGVKPTSFGIQFERAANVFQFLDATGKTIGKPVKPGIQGRAKLNGVDLLGEKSIVKAGKKVAIIRVTFIATNPELSGEWAIEVRAQGISGKTMGWQRLGWLTLQNR